MRPSLLVGIAAFTGLLLSTARAAGPRLTIYNQNFAVVRMFIPLDLNAGENRVQFTDTTAYLEPSSVILRDPAGVYALRILEQNYRADPVSQPMLLSLYEGKTLDFIVQSGGRTEIVRGKIIRSGYGRQNQQPYYRENYVGAVGDHPAILQPLIEVDGKLRFGLPGIPQFPALADDTILKPTLDWILESDRAGPISAELSYVTGQINWNADYNLISPQEGDLLDMIGWVTINNQSGKTFSDARIKLMAGEVNKLLPQDRPVTFSQAGLVDALGTGPSRQVTEKPFEEYHLYELPRPTTLHDQETKQVEFVRAAGIKSERIYVYDGMKVDQSRYGGWNVDMIRGNSEYGTESNPDVWVMREFINSQVNHLGMPLPAGRLRFYRQDADGQVEFTGENEIKHTPRDETLRVFTGNAFDIKGERRRTDYRIDQGQRWVDESFEIKLRNHKQEPVVVRVVEHFYRGATWEIAAKSDTYLKTDSQTIEFRVSAAPDSEKTLTYTAHYTW